MLKAMGVSYRSAGNSRWKSWFIPSTAMKSNQNRLAWNIGDLDSPFSMVILGCLVALVCYLAGRAASSLLVPPEHFAVYWPATPFLVAVLVLTPRRIWPVLIGAGLGAMTLCDFQNDVPIGSIIYFLFADVTAVLVATLGVSHFFKGTPTLNSAKTLGTFLVFGVIAAPFASAFLGAIPSKPGAYWLQWRLWFFSDALAFLTVAPAILSWAREGREWSRRPRNYVEFAALMTSLLFLGYFTFVGSERWGQPALLYSLVPLLLWAALRLGLKGVSTSMVVIVLLSIGGAANGRGPFADQGLLDNALSLQLFLFFAAIPFTVLAVLVEEQKRAQKALIDEHRKLTEAQSLAQLGNWRWDRHTGAVTWSLELYRIAGIDPKVPPPNFKEMPRFYTAESWERLQRAIEEALSSGTPYELDLEVIRPDTAKRWMRTRGEPVRDAADRVIALHGTAQDITERKLAEEAVLESERRFRLVANTAPVMIWMTGSDRKCEFLNQTWLDFVGHSAETEFATGWAESIHPKDFTRSLDTYSQAFDRRRPFSMEYRLRRFDGEYRWVLDVGVPRINTDGSFAGYIGSAVDVSERKKAEEVLATVAGRLIEAQEGERLRIARELHDDICQRLSLLTIDLEMMAQDPPDSAVEVRSRIHEHLKREQEISADIQAMSHRLHSSNLRYLGIAVAAKGFCQEFSEQHKAKIDFNYADIPSAVPEGISLCLFRVMQEALHNALKHSGVRHFEVELQGVPDGIHLTVRDSGLGFDPEAVKNNLGLGLVSMQERVNVVKGTFSVESWPEHGTTIRAHVPLSPECSSMSAAG
jgi:PAS domain S-box-containing protein